MQMVCNFNKISSYFNESELEILNGMSDKYAMAIAIIGRVYAEKEDKSKNSMAGHFVRVSEMLETEDEKICGLLHDIVEDEMVTYKDLFYLGIAPHIIDALKLLNHDKNVYPNYEDYITSILESSNELAIRVKYADMLDNTSEKRLNMLEESTKLKLKNKYRFQLPRLKEKVEELNKKINLKRERKCV